MLSLLHHVVLFVYDLYIHLSTYTFQLELKMLLHLLLIFALFNSVSCDLLCCRLQARLYNYSLTTDTIPSDISHCEPGYGSQTVCYFTIVWYFHLNQTQVMIGGYSTYNESLITSDSLSVNIRTSQSLTPSNPYLKYTIDYTCSTSGCNNGSVFKRLLETLTLKDQFNDFLYLLESNTTGRVSFPNNDRKKFTSLV